MVKPKYNANTGYGYSTEFVKRYFDEEDIFLLLDVPVEIKNAWVDGKPTDKIEYYVHEFYVVGRGTIKIKFSDELPELSPFTEVKISGLEGMKSKEYGLLFRAKKVEVVKEWNLAEVN